MSQDAPVTKVWRKSVNRYWRYRGNIKLPRESHTDARTHFGQRHGRTTRKHIASAGAYRQRRLNKNKYTESYSVMPQHLPVFVQRQHVEVSDVVVMGQFQPSLALSFINEVSNVLTHKLTLFTYTQPTATSHWEKKMQFNVGQSRFKGAGDWLTQIYL